MTVERTINILLVEDNPIDALFIRELLSEMEFTRCYVQWVELAAKGKQWLEDHPGKVDLVLLDLFLPDSAGMNTILNFKPFIPGIPIVVLTGLDKKEMARDAIKEGAQDYICKTELNSDILENSLRFAIERHQLIMQLEKKKNQVKESELRFRRIIEKNADGILILDLEGRIKFINPAGEKILGKARGELSKQLFDQVRHRSESVELHVLWNEKETRFVEIRGKEIEWEGKRAYLASIRDITERKQLEKSLAVEKEQLDITLRSIGDGVIATDKNGGILLINPAAQRMTGWPQQEALGKNISRVLELELSPGPGGHHPFFQGTTISTLNGEEIMIDYSRAPILDKENQVMGYVFTIRDITLQQRMAEEMIKIQKLESLGKVARKLSHEYDDAFTVILGNISTAKNLLSGEDRVFKMLEKSEKSALRAKKLTNQLHTFSRAGASYRKNISIVKLLRDVVKDILGDEAPAVLCQWDIPPDLWSVEFDRDQMHSAFWNIIKNAKESMPNGGMLEIFMQNAVISKKMLLPLKSGSYVKISIKDHGVGMEKEMLQNIFDPFFTTKEKTTGIGLTTSYSIIRDHQGTIEVESEKGVGSTFTVLLPAVVSRGEKPGKEKDSKRRRQEGDRG
jgi:PAS domain S-box-containing protein